MKSSKFWLYLIIISIFTGLGLYLVHSYELFAPHFSLSAILFALMFVTSVFLFYLGRKSSLSSNKYSFIRLVIISVMLKIVIVVGLIAVYVKTESPDNRFFVLPFIGVYIIFSIFETMVLYRLALNKSTDKHE